MNGDTFYSYMCHNFLPWAKDQEIPFPIIPHRSTLTPVDCLKSLQSKSAGEMVSDAGIALFEIVRSHADTSRDLQVQNQTNICPSDMNQPNDIVFPIQQTVPSTSAGEMVSIAVAQQSDVEIGTNRSNGGTTNILSSVMDQPNDIVVQLRADGSFKSALEVLQERFPVKERPTQKRVREKKPSVLSDPAYIQRRKDLLGIKQQKEHAKQIRKAKERTKSARNRNQNQNREQKDGNRIRLWCQEHRHLNRHRARRPQNEERRFVESETIGICFHLHHLHQPHPVLLIHFHTNQRQKNLSLSHQSNVHFASLIPTN